MNKSLPKAGAKKSPADLRGNKHLLHLGNTNFKRVLFHLEINLGIIEVFTVAITEERFAVYGPNPARHGIAVMYEFRGFLVGGACAVFRNKRQSLSQINIFNKAKIKELGAGQNPPP